jgi:hypothetical protein
LDPTKENAWTCGAVIVAEMLDLVNDGELLINYALRNNISLPSDSVSTLLAARAILTDLVSPGAARIRFYEALQTIVDKIGIKAADLRASDMRRERLEPLVRDAESLLEYAAANAKEIDDEIRNPLLTVAESVARGTPDLGNEQAFFRAYEALTTKTSPVTAETLVASRTVLPDWGRLFSMAGFWETCREVTIGRFLDAFVFILILVTTCIALNYYSLGSKSLDRYRDLSVNWTKTIAELNKDKEILMLSQEAASRNEAKTSASTQDAQGLDLARKGLLDAQRQVDEEETTVSRIAKETDFLADWLLDWSRKPCRYWITKWALCPMSNKADTAGKDTASFIKVEAARTDVLRLSEVVLPLLLGWLGAHAFVLRKMASDINGRSFDKSSSLHHIVRVSLGALAGVASTWLLTPELVGGDQLKHLPPWALAFIAGYGIELVFAFMDRIIAAFASKP